MQKVAQVMVPHLAVIGDLHLMPLQMVPLTHHLGMDLADTVDDTVTHLKMVIQVRVQILAVERHQIGCHQHLHLVLDIR